MLTVPRSHCARTRSSTSGSSAAKASGRRSLTTRCRWLTLRTSTRSDAPLDSLEAAPKPVIERSMTRAAPLLRLALLRGVGRRDGRVEDRAIADVAVANVQRHGDGQEDDGHPHGELVDALRGHAEGLLAVLAEGLAEAAAAPLLQQDDDDQDHRGDREEDVEERVDHGFGLGAASMIGRKVSLFKEDPPTRAPSTSGAARIAAAFCGLTLPPYWMQRPSAAASSCRPESTPRRYWWTWLACSGVAFWPMPMAHTGS